MYRSIGFTWIGDGGVDVEGDGGVLYWLTAAREHREYSSFFLVVEVQEVATTLAGLPIIGVLVSFSDRWVIIHSFMRR